MPKKIILLLYTIIFSSISFPQLKLSYIGDLKLEGGGEIKNCFVGYRTFGELNVDSSNVLLFPTWFAGTSGHLTGHIGAGKIADSTKYFVIAVDALGDGVSSSPSNSKEQPGDSFPLFTVRDMVESQYLMLKKEFGLRKIFGIVGGSMGGMQVFEWITAYPEFISKAVSYVGTPRLTFYDKLLWHIELSTIELGLKLGQPDSVISDVVSAMQSSHIRTIEYYNNKYKPEDFNSYIESNNKTYRSLFNSRDWASQLRAMMQHDVSKKFGNSLEEAAAAYKGSLLIITGEGDMMVNPAPAREFARLGGFRYIELENNCGHLAPGCSMDYFVKEINGFFDSK